MADGEDGRQGEGRRGREEFGMGGGGGGSPSSEQEEGTKPIGEKPYGCCTFIQHSEITKMPSAGHENYVRWHEIFTGRCVRRGDRAISKPRSLTNAAHPQADPHASDARPKK